jgi:ribosomal protein L10
VLASIPSRNELLAKLVGSLASSMTGFVRTLDAIRIEKEKVSA